MARRLVKAGHKVTLITSSAYFPDHYELGWFTRLELDGIDLMVIGISYANRMGFVRRLWAFFSFALCAFYWVMRVKCVDVVFASSTPLTIIIPGWLASRSKGVPLVFEVRDLWPSLPIAIDALRNPVSISLARLLEKWAYRSAAHIVALSPGMRDGIAETGIKTDKITIIPNGSDIDQFRVPASAGTEFLEQHSELQGGPLIVYTGTLGHINGVTYFVEVAKSMKTLDPSVKFLICGDGAEKKQIRRHADKCGVLGNNLWIYDPIPKTDMPSLLSAATIATSLFLDIPQMQHNSANKFFDALAAGRPIAINYGGWHKDLAEGRGAGLALPPDDANAAANELRDFLNNPEGVSRAGYQAAALADSLFNRDILASTLRGVLEKVGTATPTSLAHRHRALFVKRLFDAISSLIALIILTPAMIGIALAIWCSLGRPILFSQIRPGLRGRPFRLIKFRTMADARDARGRTLPDGERLTAFGRFLRSTSLDELPELLNVLTGDMSLVGPRPLLMEYLPYYNSNQNRRHEVKPGITGWAQISGRNALTWEEKFSFDIWYIDNYSFWLDIETLFKTFWVVLKGRGVSASDHVTMPRFDEMMAKRQGAEDE